MPYSSSSRLFNSSVSHPSNFCTYRVQDFALLYFHVRIVQFPERLLNRLLNFSIDRLLPLLPSRCSLFSFSASRLFQLFDAPLYPLFMLPSLDFAQLLHFIFPFRLFGGFGLSSGPVVPTCSLAQLFSSLKCWMVHFSTSHCLIWPVARCSYFFFHLFIVRISICHFSLCSVTVCS